MNTHEKLNYIELLSCDSANLSYGKPALSTLVFHPPMIPNHIT